MRRAREAVATKSSIQKIKAVDWIAGAGDNPDDDEFDEA